MIPLFETTLRPFDRKAQTRVHLVESMANFLQKTYGMAGISRRVRKSSREAYFLYCRIPRRGGKLAGRRNGGGSSSDTWPRKREGRNVCLLSLVVSAGRRTPVAKSITSQPVDEPVALVGRIREIQGSKVQGQTERRFLSRIYVYLSACVCFWKS